MRDFSITSKVDAALKQLLDAECQENSLTMSKLIFNIIAQHYNYVKITPIKVRRPKPIKEPRLPTTLVSTALSEELIGILRRLATSEDQSIAEVINLSLSSLYIGAFSVEDVNNSSYDLGSRTRTFSFYIDNRFYDHFTTLRKSSKSLRGDILTDIICNYLVRVKKLDNIKEYEEVEVEEEAEVIFEDLFTE